MLRFRVPSIPSLSAHLIRSFASSSHLSKSRVCAVLGSQWGDEGKGKLVDILANQFDLVARFNGGSNAGHTLVVNKQKFAFHLLPCGLLYPGKLNVIGNGVVIHVPTFLTELNRLKAANISTDGRLFISDRAHLLFDIHQLIDGRQELALGKSSIGTTKKGIGPCYSSKTTRNGVRVGELKDFKAFEEKYRNLITSLKAQYQVEFDGEEELNRFREYANILTPMIRDTTHLINSELNAGKKVLAEGANAAMLDIDHGTYPFVTSSATAAGGICTGLGVAPSKIGSTIGVVKAYTTRVGSGPFPTELLDEVGESLRKVGHEFGTTTGRPRRCGWLDIPVLKYSDMINDYESINITKLDVLSGLKSIKIGVAYELDGKRLADSLMPANLNDYGRVKVVYESMPGWSEEIAHCRKFEELPKSAQNYLNRIEELIKKPIKWIGVGAGREDMAIKQMK